MKTWLFALAAAFFLGSSFGQAADLARIERKIAKEPIYKGKPKYCLLVFGPEAKTRIWLVQDENLLYVDRNANGDLTEEGKRIEMKDPQPNFRAFEAGDIKDGPLTHTGLSVMQFQVSSEAVANPKEFERIKKDNPQLWTWWVRVTAERPPDYKKSLPQKLKYVANGDGLGYLLFADRPEDAPIIQFNGPWSLALQDVKQRITAGHESMLQIGIGTQGIGPGTFSFVEYPNTIPNTVYPVADITFPPKNSNDKPIQKKYTLKQRC